ncbi:MAG: HEAT repeat domain-containing protein [Bryobacteraceae bacterium]
MQHFSGALLIAALAFVPGLPAQSSSKDKIKNIDALAKQGDPAIEQLRGYFQDSDPKVRREAVDAIATIGGAKSLDPLVEAAKEQDAEVRQLAVDGLVNFYYPGYRQTGISGSLKRLGRGIKGRFTDTNDQVIHPAIEVRADVREAIATAVGLGVNYETRAVAARGAGVLRVKEAKTALTDSLKTKDTTLIYESLVALQKIRDPETAPAVEFLLQDLNERVQIAALETVGLLRNRSASPGIRAAITRARNGKVRAAAVGALAMLGDESNRSVFDTYYSDPDDNLRAAAAEGYARIGNHADLEKVERNFESETKMKPRLSLAFAAVSLGRTNMAKFSPLEYLVNTLNNSGYRSVAAAFLRELSYRSDVRESLYPGMESRTKAEKQDLAEALAYTGDAKSVPVLEALTKDPDGEVSQAASRALASVRARVR